MNSLIDWDSPTFGARETCVHESSTGSWVADAHTHSEAVDQ
jgi:hypothetical protein